jgi:hypothetical protein
MGQMATLQVYHTGKVHASPAGRKPFQPAIGLGCPRGYPDIRRDFGGEKDIRILWWVSASG